MNSGQTLGYSFINAKRSRSSASTDPNPKAARVPAVDTLCIIIAAYGNELIYKDIESAMTSIDISGLKKPPGGAVTLEDLCLTNNGEYQKDSNGSVFCTIRFMSNEREKVIFFIIDPTRDVLAAKLESFFTTITKGDSTSTIYYGGHGQHSDEPDESGFVVQHDGLECIFSMTKLKKVLRKFNSGTIYLNCCYSNQLIEMFGIGAMTQLRAGQPDNLPKEDLALLCNGYFEGWNVHAMKDSLAPADTALNPIIKDLCARFGTSDTVKYSSQFSLGRLLRSERGASITLTEQAGTPPTDQCALYMFKGGSIGDCFLIVSEGGACNIIVDGHYAQHFKEKAWPIIGKIMSYNLMVGTHVDDDHIRGLELIATDFPTRIEALWLNSVPLGFRTVATAVSVVTKWQSASEKVVEQTYHPREFKSVSEKTSLRVISPTKECYKKYSSKKPNRVSIVSVLYVDDVPKVLFTGDCDANIIVERLRALSLAETVFEAVVLPHHGSVKSNKYKDRSGKVQWLHRVVKSKIFLINGNSGEHPHRDLCIDLDEFLCAVSDVVVHLASDRKNAEYFPLCNATDKVVVCDSTFGRFDVSGIAAKPGVGVPAASVAGAPADPGVVMPTVPGGVDVPT